MVCVLIDYLKNFCKRGKVIIFQSSNQMSSSYRAFPKPLLGPVSTPYACNTLWKSALKPCRGQAPVYRGLPPSDILSTGVVSHSFLFSGQVLAEQDQQTGVDPHSTCSIVKKLSSQSQEPFYLWSDRIYDFCPNCTSLAKVGQKHLISGL